MMRIVKRDDGWWIIGVPAAVAGGERHTDCGPYRTKADAADDKLGLERFFRAHPVGEVCLPGFPVRRAAQTRSSSHWFVKSLEFKPPKLRKPRRFKYSPRQRMLPGFEVV